MPKMLSFADLQLLRELRHGNSRVAEAIADVTLGKFIKMGLIKGDLTLTDKGFDALLTHHLLDQDESTPRWELAFKSYLRRFSDEGLSNLFKDAKHDMLWLFNPRTFEEDDIIRLGRKSFESCPLSYRDGVQGSFCPNPHHVEHTENAFVTFWDELMGAPRISDRGSLSQLDVITRLVEFVRLEMEERGLDTKGITHET
jgi:hypothetical protein